MPWIWPEGLDAASYDRVCCEPVAVQPGVTERRLLVFCQPKLRRAEQSYSGNSTTSPYFLNFHDDPVVDGMNLWNPFPQIGVSACNQYGICTPVVSGDRGDCGP